MANAQFDVACKRPMAAAKKCSRTRIPEGWAATFRATTKPGDYRIVVKAKDGARRLRIGGGSVPRAESRFELDRPAAEPTLMAQLAEMTKPAGGAAMAAEELPDLLKRLAAQPPELKEEVIAKVTYWDTWPFFLAFVGLAWAASGICESDGDWCSSALTADHVQCRSEVICTVLRLQPRHGLRGCGRSCEGAPLLEALPRARTFRDLGRNRPQHL